MNGMMVTNMLRLWVEPGGGNKERLVQQIKEKEIGFCMDGNGLTRMMFVQEPSDKILYALCLRY